MSAAPLSEIFSQPPPKSMPSYTIYDNDVESSEKRKQQHKLNFLKYKVQQHNKKAQNACVECYNALSKVELAAFDCLIADYFLGDCQINELRDFIACCAMPPFSLVNADRNDIAVAEQHIQYIFSKLQQTSQSLQRYKDHKIEPQKRPSEILSFLREQKSNLDRNRTDIKPTSQQQIDQMSSPSNQAVPSNPGFYKWLRKTMKSELSESTRIRQLIAKVSSKYNTVADLREATENLRQSKIAPQTINYEMCGLDNILHSPYISSAHSNYVFLQSMLSSIRSQKSYLIPRCQHLISRCQEMITNVQQKTEKMRAESIQQSQTLRSSLDRRIEDVNEIKKKIEPYTRSLIAAENVSSLEKFTEIAEDLDKILSEKITSKGNAPELLNLLKELHTARKDTQTLAEFEINKMISAATIQKTYYNVIRDFSKADDQVYQSSRELTQLTSYEKYLTELSDLLKVRDIENWNQNLALVTTAFSELQEESTALAEAVTPLIEVKSDTESDAELEAMENKVNELLEERIRLSKELTDIALDNAHATEELYNTVTKFTVLESDSANCRSESEEKQILKLQEKILCPICHKNRRNCLITTCMHPICKNCMAEAGGQCPICGESFDDEDVKMFWFQN